MEEVLCPACGNPNSEERETCWNCGATLGVPRLAAAAPETGAEQATKAEAEESGRGPFPQESSEEQGSDWLAKLRGAASYDRPREDKAETSEPAENVSSPDQSSGEASWLERLRAVREEEPEPMEEPEAATTRDQPEWLRRIRTRAETEGVKPSTPDEDTEEFGTSEGEWAERLRSPAPAEPTPRPEPPADTEAETEENWLNRLRKKVGKEPEGVPSAPASPPRTEARRRLGQILRGGTGPLPELPPGVPGWLSVLRQKETGPPSETDAESSGAPPGPEGMPLEGAPSAEEARQSEGPEVPASIRPAEAAPRRTASWTPGAGVPDWLAAFRPVELDQTAQPETPANDVEWSGPLAGMKGILQAEPVIAIPQKAGPARAGLEVSDVQAARAELLRGLWEEEARPAQPGAPGRRGLTLERWLISLALFLAILLPTIFQASLLPRPAAIPPETLAIGNLISKELPQGAAVLLVFDYDAGNSGELDLAASALIDHLMIRGIRLATLSTRPAGPALAARLFSRLADEHQYTYGENYVHLGYVSGEGTGLSALALDLQATRPTDFQGDAVWERPALAGIRSLSDFSLVLVISGTPEGVRVWLEQAGRFAGSARFVAALSASSEPMVTPYTVGQSPQLSGMVTGFVGAGGYERLTGRPGQALSRWDAFGFGLLVATAVLLLGLVLQVSPGMGWPRGKRGPVAAASRPAEGEGSERPKATGSE